MNHMNLFLGKTLHLASLSGNQNCIVAFERSKNRYEILVKNLQLHDANSVTAFNMDPTKLSCAEILEACSGKIARNVKGFHRIVLDPPCSGFGKRPDLHPQLPKANFSSLQRMLLSIALNLLLPGGVLIYSTCSILPEENEMVLHHVMEKRDDIKIADLQYDLGIPGIPVEGRDCFLKCRRFLPSKTDTVGFFICKIQRL